MTTPDNPWPERQRAAYERLLAELDELDRAAEAAEKMPPSTGSTDFVSTGLSVRVSRELAEALRRRAQLHHLSVSELMRRILHDAVLGDGAPALQRPLTSADVEEIARRVVREELRSN